MDLLVDVVFDCLFVDHVSVVVNFLCSFVRLVLMCGWCVKVSSMLLCFIVV